MMDYKFKLFVVRIAAKLGKKKAIIGIPSRFNLLRYMPYDLLLNCLGGGRLGQIEYCTVPLEERKVPSD